MNPEVELPIMEAFETIQGEGFHSGKAAYFIRLGGCDVGCHWCDVKESWTAENHPLISHERIIQEAKNTSTKLIVVTGGEPLIYNLSAFTSKLKAADFTINIETSGVYPITGEWDWICFSPKKNKKPQPEFYQKSHELKVVIFHKSDLQWAEIHADKMNPKAQLFLQPEWSKEKQMLPLIIEYIKQNPKWRISLQTHKYMNIP